jgi:hypothetical protein
MWIEIVTDQRGARRWHLRLRERLLGLEGVRRVAFRQADCAASWPASISHLLTLERILSRQHGRVNLLEVALRAELPEELALAPEVPELVIDLSGAAPATPEKVRQRTLRPVYEGEHGELAAVAALLAGSAPVIGLENEDGVLVAAGLPSLEAAIGLTGGLEATVSRVAALIEGAVVSPRQKLNPKLAPSPQQPLRSPAAFFMRNLAHNALRAIYHLCCHSPHWRVGWRFNDGPGVMETGALGGGRWEILPDQSSGFSADPFPIGWRGRNCIFYEWFDYTANKGVIYGQSFDTHGPVGKPFLALEEPWHLSYPFLIEEGGELYMMPEASISGAVTLYRCVEFPRKWERVSQLLTGIEAADATIFRHDGRFWMTSVIRDGVGGYSDTLAIHHAQNLFGPWEPHALRPVMIDARYARPAGAVVERAGALWRPVQQCSAGYGKGLALARIDTLDPENFSQSIMRMISPGRYWPGNRLHTLNRSGRLECIDGAILTPKPLLLRKLMHDVVDRARRGGAVDPEANDWNPSTQVV